MQIFSFTSSNLLTSLDKRFTICPVVVLASAELLRHRAFAEQRCKFNLPRQNSEDGIYLQAYHNDSPFDRSYGTRPRESSSPLVERGRNRDGEGQSD